MHRLVNCTAAKSTRRKRFPGTGCRESGLISGQALRHGRLLRVYAYDDRYAIRRVCLTGMHVTERGYAATASRHHAERREEEEEGGARGGETGERGEQRRRGGYLSCYRPGRERRRRARRGEKGSG
eukprot:3875632-Rhodomonas_salina.1